MDMTFSRIYFQRWMFLIMQLRIFAEDICWSTFGDFQYKVLTDVGGTSFSNAVSACENFNTTLTSVTSYEEDKFLQTFAMSQLGVPVWIGLYRKHDNMSWIDGSEVDYINKDYSRKHYDEGCVYMFQGWIEASCNNAKLYFICKREVLEANTCTATTEAVRSGITASSEETDSIAAVSDGQYNLSDKTTSYEGTIVTSSVSTGYVKSSDKSTTAGENTIDGVSVAEDIKDKTKPVTSLIQLTTELGTETELSKRNLSSTSSLIVKSTSSVLLSTSVSTLQIPVRSSTNSNKDDAICKNGVTSLWDSTFEKLLDEMTVKEKPVYKTKEAENSAAIGSVSILFLVGIVVGVVLLDIGTIKHHARMFQNNTKGLCNNCRKEQNRKKSDVFELKEIIDL